MCSCRTGEILLPVTKGRCKGPSVLVEDLTGKVVGSTHSVIKEDGSPGLRKGAASQAQPRVGEATFLLICEICIGFVSFSDVIGTLCTSPSISTFSLKQRHPGYGVYSRHFNHQISVKTKVDFSQL